MEIDFTTTLKDQLVVASPLKAEDFDDLYKAASDPLIWEQHPNKNRYTLEGFFNYFEGALNCGSAYTVRDAQTGEVIGSSRYTIKIIDEEEEFSIGYTFFKRSHWQKGYNRSLKKLMLQHAFQFTDKVYFYIGSVNLRSRQSIEKLGAKKVREEETAYYGEAPKLDFVYLIEKKYFPQILSGSGPSTG